MRRKFSGLLCFVIISIGAIAQPGNSHFKSIQQALLNTKSKVVMIAAHRGADNNVPENSVAAIKEAIQLKIDVVELDVRFTKDRKLVLMHNKTINGTTNGKGQVSDFTFEEIRAFRLMHKNTVTDEVIPTLEEALLAAKGKILIDLDIKQDECLDSIMALVTRTGTEKNCLFFVYEPALAEMIHHTSPAFQLMVRTESAQAVDTLFNVVRPQVVHIDPGHYSKAVVKTLKKGKCRVWINALGAVDKKAAAGDINAYDDLIKFGANMIQTDQPELVKKYLESKGWYYKEGRARGNEATSKKAQRDRETEAQSERSK
jgi:glycerophosphoryl diester phosphodiesterase